MAFEDRDRGKEMRIKEKARLKRKPAPPPKCAHSSMVMSLYLVQHEKNLYLLYCKDCGERIPFELMSDKEWKTLKKKLNKVVP